MRKGMIQSVFIHPNPHKDRLRAHNRLEFMVEARLEDGVVERRFFAQKTEAKQWVGRQFMLGRFLLKNTKENSLH